ETALQRSLRWAPLAWVGERSYGLYLWHWPLILIVSAALPATLADSALSWLSRTLAVTLSVLAAWASYRWVEMPVRQLGFKVAVTEFARWAAQPWAQARLPRLIAVTLAVLMGLSIVAVASAPTKSAVQRQIESGEVIAQQSVFQQSVAQPAPAPAAPAADFSMPTGPEITAFGDSLVVTSSGGLTNRLPGIMLDAKSNRQWPAGEQAVQVRLAEGTVRRAVVLDFGTNAGVSDPQLVHNVINALGPSRMIVLVNLFGSWQEDNPKLTAIAAQHPNVIIADWAGAISQQPGLLQADGVHPGIKGAVLYADVIKDAFAQLSARMSAPHR
ncbi:MAG: acyltransferase family protein, partial [Mycobacteriaceae bacterium]